MNIISLEPGEGREGYAVIQSITRNIPIVCSGKEVRKSLMNSGKLMSYRMDPNGTSQMPTPITFEEFDSGNFNKSLEYIFLSINDYFEWKGLKVRTMVTDIK